MLSLPEGEAGSALNQRTAKNPSKGVIADWRPGCLVIFGQHIMGIGHFTPAGVEYPDETKYNNISGGYAFGCHVAEVEVNTKTGQIKVSNIFAVHDVGQPINRLALEGQLQGGIAQGYGWALMEHLKHNEKGRVANACFLDY